MPTDFSILFLLFFAVSQRKSSSSYNKSKFLGRKQNSDEKKNITNHLKWNRNKKWTGKKNCHTQFISSLLFCYVFFFILFIYRQMMCTYNMDSISTYNIHHTHIKRQHIMCFFILFARYSFITSERITKYNNQNKYIITAHINEFNSCFFHCWVFILFNSFYCHFPFSIFYGVLCVCFVPHMQKIYVKRDFNGILKHIKWDVFILF